MLKRFFVALIVGLFVLSSQIAAAEDYDWSQAPRIGTKAELARYVENERHKGNTTFTIILTNSLVIYNQSELQKLCDSVSNLVIANIQLESYGLGSGRVLFKITKEYPGTHVANAYLNGDKSKLTNEELDLYDIAVGIVAEANKRQSEIEKARYIHDEICRRVKGYKVENDRNKTAIGALIDGYAHCQGFADAFYMLGRMCGLDVVRIGGTFQGESHAWNFITFSDGKTYCVDVTGTFNSKSSMELLTFETMKPRYSCEWEIIPNLQRN